MTSVFNIGGLFQTQRHRAVNVRLFIKIIGIEYLHIIEACKIQSIDIVEIIFSLLEMHLKYKNRESSINIKNQ